MSINASRSTEIEEMDEFMAQKRRIFDRTVEYLIGAFASPIFSGQKQRNKSINAQDCVEIGVIVDDTGISCAEGED